MLLPRAWEVAEGWGHGLDWQVAGEETKHLVALIGEAQVMSTLMTDVRDRRGSYSPPSIQCV